MKFIGTRAPFFGKKKVKPVRTTVLSTVLTMAALVVGFFVARPHASAQLLTTKPAEVTSFRSLLEEEVACVSFFPGPHRRPPRLVSSAGLKRWTPAWISPQGLHTAWRLLRNIWVFPTFVSVVNCERNNNKKQARTVLGEQTQRYYDSFRIHV